MESGSKLHEADNKPARGAGCARVEAEVPASRGTDTMDPSENVTVLETPIGASVTVAPEQDHRFHRVHAVDVQSLSTLGGDDISDTEATTHGVHFNDRSIGNQWPHTVTARPDVELSASSQCFAKQGGQVIFCWRGGVGGGGDRECACEGECRCQC